MSDTELRLDAVFENLSSLNINLIENPDILADFGSVYAVEKSKVLYATTATWNSQPQLVSMKGYIYIYSDYRQDDNGNNITGIKIGDGLAYLIDLPFKEEVIDNHINDTIRHITDEEREFWNNKVRCYLSDVTDDRLIFTTN